MGGDDVQVPATVALLAGLRRLIRKEPAATTVTVTRVVSDPEGAPVPETVVVETQEPEKDTVAIRLLRLTLFLTAATLGIVVVTVGFRVLRHELRYHR